MPYLSVNREGNAKRGRIISIFFVFTQNNTWWLILDLPQCIFNDSQYYSALNSFEKPKYNTVYDVYLYPYLFSRIFYHSELKSASFKQNIQARNHSQALMVFFFFFFKVELSDFLMDASLSHWYWLRLSQKVWFFRKNWAP